MEFDDTLTLDHDKKANLRSGFVTLYIGGGKREKVSRGDILGFLVKECGAEPGEIGKIDVYDHYALVAVRAGGVRRLVEASAGKKLKGEKRKISVLNLNK